LLLQQISGSSWGRHFNCTDNSITAVKCLDPVWISCRSPKGVWRWRDSKEHKAVLTWEVATVSWCVEGWSCSRIKYWGFNIYPKSQFYNCLSEKYCNMSNSTAMYLPLKFTNGFTVFTGWPSLAFEYSVILASSVL
jgi:hypothetical protein